MRRQSAQSGADARIRSQLGTAWQQKLPFPARNVLRRWRQLIGVMVGVGIALGVAMTMLGVSQVTVDFLAADFKRSGADIYVTTEGGKLIAILPGDTPGTMSNGTSTLSRIRALPGVHSAIGVITGSLVRDPEGPRRDDVPTELVVVLGVDGDPAEIPGALVLDRGRWLRRTNEVVLGPKLAREKALAVGDTLRLEQRELTIVGVGKLRGLGAGFASDTVAFLDYRTFRERSGYGDLMNLIAVDTAAPEQNRERIGEFGGLSVSTPADLVGEASKINESTIGVYWVLIGLTLAIAGLFINNVLGRSVAERRAEFATLRAIGVPTRTVLLTVAGEATAIGVVAAALGMAMAQAIGAMLNAWLAPAYSVETFYSPDAKLFLLVFALSLGLGVVSGLFPARAATRVDPVIVLREA